MYTHLRSRPGVALIFLLTLILVLVGAAISYAAPGGKPNTIPVHRPGHDGPLTVISVESLGKVISATGTIFAGTEVGGLSGITYDAHRGVYYALSDDRSQFDPARYYTLDIDLGPDGHLDPGDVTFMDVTYLRTKRGALYPPGSLDPEGIEMPRPGFLLISSEGDEDTTPMTDPFVNRYNPVGKLNRALPVPDKYLYSVDGGNNVRDNLAFESLTSTPNRRNLYAATENALANDGPRSTLVDTSPSRVLQYNLNSKRPGHEFIYCVETIPQAPNPPGSFADNGLVELQALDNHGTFLAMERSFAVGVGNTVKLFETSVHGATDISAIPALNLDGCPTSGLQPMSKQLVADFEIDLGEVPDNLEGMTFGPRLPDGRMLMIVVSDNNFNPAQETQFIALAVELGPAP